MLEIRESLNIIYAIAVGFYRHRCTAPAATMADETGIGHVKVHGIDAVSYRMSKIVETLRQHY